ncbi:ATP-binding protein [Aureimonas altamirensis]|uniref:ATP-binding protein n=1 Tax=Aureimonas altamirensis TaxID=370622 RepID=UPI001E30AC24|nr:ATP-binding protein [Aureimonas altamirensis]UHD46246.1 ATP-binding protein [Aureimonas altamirensis]
MRWIAKPGAIWLAAACVVALACIGAAGPLARQHRLSELSEEAARAAPLARAVLASEIGKQRSVPLILSQDTDIAGVLAATDADALRRTDERLAQLAGQTGASVIYLIDAAGDTVAASNHAQADSFVGNNYAFRDYFQRALHQGAGEQYGLGTVSRRPGLYLSRRVDGADGRALGVVVVKVELDSVEQAWAASGRPTFVDDGRGVVLATSVPDWRFRALRPLTPSEAEAIRYSIQFADAGLQPLDMTGMAGTAVDGIVTVDVGSGMQAHVEATLPLQDNPAEWRIHVLVPAAAALAQAQLYWRGITALALALAFGTLFFLHRRRRWAAERRADMVRTAAVLEQRVNERTFELSAANLRLETEITERESVEARVLRLRDDLAQANRLASLGQITAGVAHEINQPLAAIRTFAENAGTFLDRGDTPRTRANLDTIAGLADRIGEITGTLRNFARRQTGVRQVMDIAEPVDGAVMMLRSRMKQQSVRLERQAPSAPALVDGNKTRLEQVFVNLLRNALDAMEGEGAILIRTSVSGDSVHVAIEDTGPGLSQEMLDRLFTPFSTTRQNGLGLGLVITADILRDLGGGITAGNASSGGACMTITLPRAAE